MRSFNNLHCFDIFVIYVKTMISNSEDNSYYVIIYLQSAISCAMVLSFVICVLVSKKSFYTQKTVRVYLTLIQPLLNHMLVLDKRNSKGLFHCK